jgi:hypothetical protein
MQHEPYDIVEAMIGHFQPTPIMCVLMPRGDFVEAVDKLVVEYADVYEVEGFPECRRVLDELGVTAREMDRFPMGIWLDEERGCGCIVGEYLVARKVLQADGVEKVDKLTVRRELCDSIFSRPNRHDESLTAELAAVEPDNYNLLISFGDRINEDLIEVAVEQGVDHGSYEEILVIDDFDAPLPYELLPVEA